MKKYSVGTIIAKIVSIFLMVRAIQGLIEVPKHPKNLIVVPIIIALSVLLWKYKKKEKLSTNQIIFVEDRPVLQTYSFTPTGYHYPCKFPSAGSSYDDRQTIIKLSKVGDIVTLTEFKWERKRAIAIINNRFGADIGVVPADYRLNDILKLYDSYDIQGRITAINISNSDKMYYTEIELQCYEKTAGDISLR